MDACPAALCPHPPPFQPPRIPGSSNPLPQHLWSSGSPSQSRTLWNNRKPQLLQLIPPSSAQNPGRSGRGLLRACRALQPRTDGVASSGSVPVVEDEQEDGRALRVALICGGPSPERGISLNSARSVLDHLQAEDVSVSCYYIDQGLLPYRISAAQMYSNTPSDFDFKLNRMAQGFESIRSFLEHLSSHSDIVFPLIHGRFGEDGGIQELLEGAGIPFVGTGSVAARRAFDKFNASMELSQLGFATIPSFLIKGLVDKLALVSWFEDNGLDVNSGRVVVKPASAGSSVGVNVAHGVTEAIERALALIMDGLDDRVVVEPFIEKGKEFTAIVLDMGSGIDSCPITLLPTEVELCLFEEADDDTSGAIFDYRRKYLPTRQVSYHTPARFSVREIQEIRLGAAKVFRELQLCDFARIDGWLLSSSRFVRERQKQDPCEELKEREIVFTDINLISGMEQTSFLFQQAAQVGLSHASILRTILLHACTRFPQISRFGKLPPIPNQKSLDDALPLQSRRQKVYVIFGGDTSERQVSLLSGTNVWLKLRTSHDLDVFPFLLAPTSCDLKLKEQFSPDSSILLKAVWTLQYALILRHTVEEVVEACLEAVEPSTAAVTSMLRTQFISELQSGTNMSECISMSNIVSEVPRQMTLAEWVNEAKKNDAVVFIAVHGGIGENGTLQQILEDCEVPYTGCRVEASKLCMDKATTGSALAHLSLEGVLSAAKEVLHTKEILGESRIWESLWETLIRKLHGTSLCVKPASDGCSTGVARLCCAKDLATYLSAVNDGLPRLGPGCLSKGHGVIEMPDSAPEKLIFEPFIETDKIIVSSKQTKDHGDGLQWEGISRWVEVTVGVIGKLGEMHAFNPSITVKESGDILSLEEKFQGGTGVNLTPPPLSIIRKETVIACKRRIELVAAALKLEGFARIDAFLHVDTGEVIVIEVNTVPGMTPSTVLIHQALEEIPPISPQDFFRKIVELALIRHKERYMKV